MSNTELTFLKIELSHLERSDIPRTADEAKDAKARAAKIREELGIED